jgi:AbrB family looped-hinge helix DNA binding protein
LYHPVAQNDSAVEPIVSAISKVTTKYQATIPQEVREFLGVRQGDAVQYLIERGEVKLRRVTTPDLAYLAAVEKTRTEWDSAADNDAFRDL